MIGVRPPQVSKRRGGGPKRSKGKQSGAAGANLAWTGTLDERPTGSPRAAVSAVVTSLRRVIWEWSSAISSMRSRSSA
jgi:hypothetical protein